MIEFAKIDRADVVREPFQFFMAENVLSKDALEVINKDFPPITQSGIFPLPELKYGPGFESLVGDIKSRELEAILERKFDVKLAELPLMITVRGWCAARDGRIHTDSTDKVVTCLLYLNESWDKDGGRLRMLREGNDINSTLAEIPPYGGTFAAFKRSDRSWHGHLPFEGQRRYVMFNWVRSEAALSRNILRHRISAKLKSIGLFR